MTDSGEIPASSVRGAKPPLEPPAAAPGSFRAGADRAIKIVEAAPERFGPPGRVRREIIRNRHAAEVLERRGAAFEKTVEGKED